MDTADSWRMLFTSWPASMPRQGLIVTIFEEIIPFVNFMTSGGILLVERDRPDSSDARKVMIAYGAISAVKSTSTMDFDKYKAFGFE
jgi:hypothetical protein